MDPPNAHMQAKIKRDSYAIFRGSSSNAAMLLLCSTSSESKIVQSVCTIMMSFTGEMCLSLLRSVFSSTYC